MSPRVRRPRDDRGTTTLEVAGMAPLVLLIMLLILQGVVALYAVSTAQTAVRQAAREFSQSGDANTGPARTVLEESVPGWMRIRSQQIDFTAAGDRRVRATFDIPDVVPFYDVTITREAVMP